MVCQGSDVWDTFYYYEYGGRRIEIMRCASCGLGTLSPMLQENEVYALYDSEYFKGDYHCGVMKGTYADEVESLRREFKPLLDRIRKFRPEGRLLEVGCAGGAALVEARDHGYSVVGVELSSAMAEWGRTTFGLDIRSGTLEQQVFDHESFDVVFMGDVVEHLLTPRVVLAEVRRVLKPGGVIALAYPMELNHIVPRLRRILRLRKRSPFKPYHLFYYTPETMGRLLESVGLHVLETRVHKMVRARPLPVRIVDSLNAVVTAVSGAYGDRGSTIAAR